MSRGLGHSVRVFGTPHGGFLIDSRAVRWWEGLARVCEWWKVCRLSSECVGGVAVAACLLVCTPPG